MILTDKSTRRLLAATAVLGLLGATRAAPAQEAKGAAPTAPPASAPGAGGPATWVIPGAAAPGVYALFPALGSPLAPTAFVTDGVEIRQGQVEACFTASGRRQCVELLHPSKAAANDQRTRHFAVHAPPGTDPALLAAAVASIRKGEGVSPWLSVSVSVSAGPGPAPPRSRRPYAIAGGVALLLVLLWLVARVGRRRDPGATPPTAGEPPATPGA